MGNPRQVGIKCLSWNEGMKKVYFKLAAKLDAEILQETKGMMGLKFCQESNRYDMCGSLMQEYHILEKINKLRCCGEDITFIVRKCKIWMKGEVAVLKGQFSANWPWQITFRTSQHIMQGYSGNGMQDVNLVSQCGPRLWKKKMEPPNFDIRSLFQTLQTSIIDLPSSMYNYST